MTYAKTDLMMASGNVQNLVAPSAHSIRIRDIAHHLATINRFAGAPALPYSVAQHSVVVAKIIEQLQTELDALKDKVTELQGAGDRRSK